MCPLTGPFLNYGFYTCHRIRVKEDRRSGSDQGRVEHVRTSVSVEIRLGTVRLRARPMPGATGRRCVTYEMKVMKVSPYGNTLSPFGYTLAGTEGTPGGQVVRGRGSPAIYR